MTLHLVLLTAACWITYWYTLKCGWVIDDIDSYTSYSGKREGGRYGDWAKKLRYLFCGGKFPSKYKYPDGKPIPSGLVPKHHHALSIAVFNLAVIATYLALSPLVGYKLALLTLLLFVAHPLATQGVAWVSGIGYPLSLLWISLSLVLARWFMGGTHGFEVSCVVFLVFSAIQYLMINALYSTAFFPILLWFLGYHSFAVLSAITLTLFAASEISWAINHRSKNFKDQNMGESTKFTLHKIKTALQTFAYYTFISLIPMKLGIYHVWGYHYNRGLERMNWRFWSGVFVALVLIGGFFVLPFAPQLAILFYIGSMFAFLNWITMQQFVAERYVFLPTLGACLLFSYCLEPFPSAYFFLLGLYLMRTWMHLPTYDNELKFYQSNVWNFPNSEVAYGNLGCTYLRMAKTGSAMDSWEISRNINPDYDVPNYNLFSNYKANAIGRLANGDLMGCIELLKMGRGPLFNAVNSPMCHFKESWAKELIEVDGWIAAPYTILNLERRRLNEAISNCNNALKTEKNPAEIIKANNIINDCNNRINHIDKILEEQKCALPLQAVGASSGTICTSSTPTPISSTLPTGKISVSNSPTLNTTKSSILPPSTISPPAK